MKHTRIYFVSVCLFFFAGCHPKSETNDLQSNTVDHKGLGISDNVPDFAHQFLMDLINSGQLDQNHSLVLEPDSIYESDLEGILSISEDASDMTVASGEGFNYDIVDDSNFIRSQINIDIAIKPSLTDSVFSILTSEEKLQLKNMWHQVQGNKKFNNSFLGFNQQNKSNWYRMSYPVFTADSNHVIVMIRDLCPGLCGRGELVLFSRIGTSEWSKYTQDFWLH